MLEITFFISTLLIAAFAIYELRMVHGFWTTQRKHDHLERVQEAVDAPAPTVLVQLPVYNEPEVVEPLIRAVSELDYPLPALRVQVLDDSTDITTQRIAATIASLPPDVSARFQHIHRTERSGFKAGALANGLNHDDSAFVAIFDADFIPPRDFLRRALVRNGLFADPDVAFVQGRWTHYNAEENALARIQSNLIDRHFLVQKPHQIANGDDITFNGSGGIWRRAAIDEAGGWEARTLCEDLDLTYRAALKGKSGRYDIDLVCPNEIPATIEAFKLQQRRWAKGTAQCMYALLPSILRLGNAERRLNNLFAVSGYLIHPLLLFYTIAWPLLVLGGTNLTFLWACQLALVLGNIAAIGAFATTYIARGATGGKVRALRDILFSTALGISLMVNNTVAFMSGLFGRRGVFDRTPKLGQGQGRALPRPKLGDRWNLIVLAEGGLAAYALGAAAIMVSEGYLLESQQTFLFGALLFGLFWIQVGPTLSLAEKSNRSQSPAN